MNLFTTNGFANGMTGGPFTVERIKETMDSLRQLAPPPRDVALMQASQKTLDSLARGDGPSLGGIPVRVNPWMQDGLIAMQDSKGEFIGICYAEHSP
jgi:hypothetical protein